MVNVQNPQRAKKPMHYTLTETQAALLEASLRCRDASAFFVAEFTEINAEIDVQRFSDAIIHTLCEAGIFASRLSNVDGAITQYVHPDVEDLFSIMNLPSTKHPGEFIEQDISLAKLAFDAPLYKSILILQEKRLIYYQRCHTVVADVKSLGILRDRVFDLYESEIDIESTSTNLRPNDIITKRMVTAELHCSERGQPEDLREWWERELHLRPEMATLCGKLPTLNACGQSNVSTVPLDSSVYKNIEDIATHTGVSIDSVLTAALMLYLHKFTGEEDLIIGVTLDDRTRFGMVGEPGPLTRSVPLRLIVKQGDTVKELIERVSASRNAVQQHPNCPDTLLGMSAMVVRDYHDSCTKSTKFNSVIGRPHDILIGPVFDLSVALEKTSDASTYQLTWHANPAHYDTGSITRHCSRLLSLLSTSSQTLLNLPVTAVNLLSEGEKRTVLSEWNDTAHRWNDDKCIHELFEARVAETPDATALHFNDTSLSYLELNAAANRLARYLRSCNVGPDKRVAICVERGVNMILGLLAILKAGGAYVPLDPSFPPDRLEYMLADSEAKILLCESSTVTRIRGLKDAPPIVNLSTDSERWATQSPNNINRAESGVTLENLVYVIYTSGSTGLPKGVGILGWNLVNYAKFIVSKLPQVSHMKFGSVSTIAADLGNTVVFPALISGGALHVIDYETATNANKFEKYMSEHALDVMKITPSHFRALFEARKASTIIPRKALVFGGERLTVEMVQSINQAYPNCRVFNHYGPTECTVGSIMMPIDDVSQFGVSVPLGYPIFNSRIYVLDNRGEPVPVGMIGEIFIAGDGVAPGYQNRPEETALRFLKDPFVEDPKARMYKTGDLGRWLPSGTIEFLGRNDFQVKIRGFRIELGEIEAALSNHPEVRECAVVAIEENFNKRLVGYYTSDNDVAVDSLRSHLLETLPDYMIPYIFVKLPAMPLTANGKLDRRALPTPGGAQGNRLRIGPTSETEHKLVAGWQKVFANYIPDVSQSFIDSGGDSLSYIQASMIVEEVIGWLPDKWDYLSLRELAKMKRTNRGALTTINSTILVRALSIALVVLDHFKALGLGGTTSALFVVSGWSIGRYVVPSMEKDQSVRPMINLIFKIVLPVTLYALAMQIYHPPIVWETILLFDNLVKPVEQGYWYIDVLVQILFLMSVVFSFQKLRRYAANNLVIFAAKATAICLLLGILINSIWNTDYLYNRVPHIKLWLFFLGMAISGISKMEERFLISGIAIAVAVAGHFAGLAIFELPYFALLAILFLISFPQVKIPVLFLRGVNNAAGASLFIYITHFQFLSIMKKFSHSPDPVLASLVALFGGIVLWKGWELIYRNALTVIHSYSRRETDLQ